MQDRTNSTLTKAQLITLSNCLNEVCNGPQAIEGEDEFFTRIGVRKKEALQLLEELSKRIDNKDIPT